MQKIGIVINKTKDSDCKVSKDLIEYLDEMGFLIYSYDSIDKTIFDKKIVILSEADFFKEIELVICLGGDGTLLQAARKLFKYDKPIVGVNLGNLGFLTEIDKSKMKEALIQIRKNDYVIEERIMLDVIINDGHELIHEQCLNDVTVSRGSSPRLIDIDSFIDNEYVDTFVGDGVIVSTPTGSTAYSLSCGGPIADPEMENILITPICPHNIYSRTFLTNANRTVKIKNKPKDVMSGIIAVDGQKVYDIKKEIEMSIKVCEKKLKLLRLQKRNFYQVLRKKLYNRGEGK